MFCAEITIIYCVEDFVRALNNNSIDVTYLLFDDEGHGLVIQENSFALTTFVRRERITFLQNVYFP
jgi:hypothetical protein